MAGIINSMRQQEQSPDQGLAQEGQPQEQLEDQQGGAVDANAQDAYDRTITAFMTMIDAAEQEIVQSLRDAGENAPQVIASTTIDMLAQLDEKSGGKVPPDILIEAATDGMELIAEMGEAAGFYQFDEAMQAQTMQSMVAIAIERGIIDKAEIEELLANTPPEEIQGMVAQQQQFAGQGDPA